MKCGNVFIQFSFYVENPKVKSHFYKTGNTIWIMLNSIEFFEVVRKAVKDYGKELATDRALQTNFIDAWSSMEAYVKDVSQDAAKSSEVSDLLTCLKTSSVSTLSQ